MKTRLIHEIGTRAYLRVYWDGKTDAVVCPNCGGTGRPGYHNAEIFLKDSDKLGDWDLGGRPEDYPDDRWPKLCDHCGEPVPDDANRQVFHKRLYDTKSGSPEPGDMYFMKYHEADERCHWGWENCSGLHLIVILPNGREWDVDGRASNCTMKEGKIHRCWCRHGEPPNITVDKNGITCAAGAGSILSGDYHGFLRNGELT